MLSVGQALKNERLLKGFSLEQVEKATKIRAKFVVALENDDYKVLPHAPYIQGFIKNYGGFLGLNINTLLALFRRQYAQKQQQNRTSLEEPLLPSPWRLTPNKVIMVTVFMLTIILFGYFYFQYQLLFVPPPLEISTPKEEFVTNKDTAEILGQTDSDAIVKINQEPVLVKSDGKFYKEVKLSLGSNTFLIEAVNRRGKTTPVVRKIERINIDAINE